MKSLLVISLLVIISCKRIVEPLECTSDIKPSMIVMVNESSVDLDQYWYTINDLDANNIDTISKGINESKVIFEKKGNFEVSLYTGDQLVETKTLKVDEDNCHVITENVNFEVE